MRDHIGRTTKIEIGSVVSCKSSVRVSIQLQFRFKKKQKRILPVSMKQTRLDESNVSEHTSIIAKFVSSKI